MNGKERKKMEKMEERKENRTNTKKGKIRVEGIKMTKENKIAICKADNICIRNREL